MMCPAPVTILRMPRTCPTILVALLALLALSCQDPDAEPAVLPAPEAAPALAAEPGEEQVIEVTREVSPTVVSVTTSTGQGSGFLVREDGIILTNAHVVGESRVVRIGLATGDEVQGRVLGAAQTIDVAVVDIPGDNLPVAPLADSDALEVGQTTIAIGNPVGFERTVTKGVLSAINRTLGFGYEELLQTDAAINPGNSGGPLLDSAGRLIGVNTAMIQTPERSAGIGFAVPVDTVNRIVPQLIRSGRVPTPGIGIMAADEEFVGRLGISGVVVMDVLAGSTAEKAGLVAVDPVRQEVGDVITHVNGKRVHTVADLAQALIEVGIGSKAELTVMRDHGTRQVMVEVVDIS